MSGLRVAYLVSRYPGLSHAFVEREIRALRARGLTVVPFSVRPADADDLRGSANLAAAAETTVLLDGRWRVWLRAHRTLLLRHPGAYVQTLRAATRTGPPGLRRRVWQVFYWAEAVVLVHHLRARGVRHVHVHFANAGADLVRRAVAVARAAYPEEGPWSWSLAMHGPVGFDDPDGHDLPAKATDAAFVACITDWCRARIEQLAPAASTVLVRMGVDLDRFRLVERDDGHPLRVLFVGRLVADKGPADLVAALAGVADLELVLAGEGPLRAELTSMAGPGVRLLGGVAQDDLPSWYAWADIFCLPSHAEGLPVVLMEALATGLPVISTPVAGIPELVVDGETGLLVPPGDRAALAAAVTRLRDPELRRRLGAAGRAAVQARHEAFAAAAPLAETLQRLLSPRPAAAARLERQP